MRVRCQDVGSKASLCLPTVCPGTAKQLLLSLILTRANKSDSLFTMQPACKIDEFCGWMLIFANEKQPLKK